MYHLGGEGIVKVGHCDEILGQRVEKLPIPMELKRVFQWTWFGETVFLGKYAIHDLREILFNEWFDRFLSSRMIAIGSSKGGDHIVVSFATERCEVGFVNCVELAGDEDIAPGMIYARISPGLDEFLFRLVEKRFLPTDYLVATQLLEMEQRYS